VERSPELLRPLNVLDGDDNDNDDNDDDDDDDDELGGID
jgi:hypothetical protein